MSIVKNKSNRLIYIVLVMLAVLILAAELTLRYVGFGDPPIAVLDDDIEYYPKPSSSYSRFGNKIEINQYGMRSVDFQESDDFDFRVTLFGDSVVYGNHFLDQRYTIASRLKQTLTKVNKAKVLVSAIAASSWGPQNINAYINKKGSFSGDVAILVQSSHDQFDIPFIPGDIIPYRTSTSLLAIFDFSQSVYQKMIRKYGQPKSHRLSNDKKLELTRVGLNSTISKLKQNYKKVILVFHATKPELKSQSSSSLDYYMEIANFHNIEFLNTLESYDSSKDIYHDYIHLSENGTYVFSELLKKAISI